MTTDSNVAPSLGDDISHPRKEQREHRQLMQLPEALMGGTEAMQAAGTDFLPQEVGESDAKYKIRLSRSSLYEGYSKTIEKLAGEVFREDIDISEDMPVEHQEWFEDVDREGNSITVYMKETFENASHEGVFHCLVDYPQSPGKTKAAHKEAGARPYVVPVQPEQVIGWRHEGRGSSRKLTQLRLTEVHEVPDGKYGVKTIERIRVLTPGAWEVLEKGKNEQGDDQWVIAKDEDGQEMKGTTNLDRIPLVSLKFGKKLSDMTARPPLLPLAHLNRTHWESSSDQRNILHYARLITYFGKMLEEPEGGGDITVGANSLITSQDPNGDFKVVEHNGAAIEAGRQDLKDLELAMSLYGLNMMLPQTGTQTATEKAINKGESDSVLHSWGRLLDAFMVKVYELMCEYVGETPAGTIKSNDSFKNVLSSTDAEILLKAYQLGLLSREIVVEELKARKIITTEVDLKDLVAELEVAQKTSTALSSLTGFGQGADQVQ